MLIIRCLVVGYELVRRALDTDIGTNVVAMAHHIIDSGIGLGLLR